MRVLTDVQWRRVSPLIEAVRPRPRTEHRDLRRTIEAIIWRHRNGATWRAVPAELIPPSFDADSRVSFGGGG